jgi:polysaccharide export outer membrane protein
LPLYLAITLFIGIWLAIAWVLLMDSIPKAKSTVIIGLLAMCLAASAHAQAPTPSTSGLPTGVARIPQSTETHSTPNPKDAPPVWRGNHDGIPPLAASQSTAPMPAPITADDLLDISEFHSPEFHSIVRVSATGTVTLPMIGEVNLEGMDETRAAQTIAKALITSGMLKHPQVFVLVTAYAGQDVSILGQVMHPGVYPYALHHRLFDLISAASGLSPDAGGVVNVYHRSDPNTPHRITLNLGGGESSLDHNPELEPGDTVEVARAGLVYVVGDVIRPGGFTVDPSQKLTVLQALSLAWGPAQNAATGKALLICEQKSGRTVTRLDLKRMLRGQDPDQPIRERDILFVPDSAAKNLFNRTIESAIQSAAGVSIYAGMVYSQRF